MPKSIIVIGTLDTKGQEIAYVRDLIAGRRPLGPSWAQKILR